MEYVVAGDEGYLSSPNAHIKDQNFSIPFGLFGYSAKPTLEVEGNASAYALYFADHTDSPDIVSAGSGLQKDNFNPKEIFRVAGSGYQSEVGSYKSNTDFFGNLEVEQVTSSEKQEPKKCPY